MGLTLRELSKKFLPATVATLEGVVKTEKYLKSREKCFANLEQFFGSARVVETITDKDVMEYTVKRRAGKITGRKVRTSCVRQDLLVLTAAMRWALGRVEGGKTLVTTNPLAGLDLPTERNPRRPTVEATVVERLEGVADAVAPGFPALLKTVRHTGRRVSSVLALRWNDIDFQKSDIEWQADADKRRKTRHSKLPKALAPVLRAHRRVTQHFDSPFVFPSPVDLMEPLDKDRADSLLERAYRLIEVTRPKGGLWHPFRRRWASIRKDTPLKDVAANGGWDDIRTLVICYQIADEETMQAVADCDVAA
jgi:integrase